MHDLSRNISKNMSLWRETNMQLNIKSVHQYPGTSRTWSIQSTTAVEMIKSAVFFTVYDIMYGMYLLRL